MALQVLEPSAFLVILAVANRRHRELKRRSQRRTSAAYEAGAIGLCCPARWPASNQVHRTPPSTGTCRPCGERHGRAAWASVGGRSTAFRVLGTVPPSWSLHLRVTNLSKSCSTCASTAIEVQPHSSKVVVPIPGHPDSSCRSW